MDNRFEKIVASLRENVALKETLLQNTRMNMDRLRTVLETFSLKLKERVKDIQPAIPIDFQVVSEYEFRLRFAGDLLIFNRYSSIVTLPADHPLAQNEYLRAEDCRGHFGQILVYNFMADSFRYNRLNDLGYMVARIMINCENHFFIEGVRPLNFVSPDISASELTVDILQEVAELSIQAAIDTDLTSVPAQHLQVLSVEEKLSAVESRTGEKLGFRFGAA